MFFPCKSWEFWRSIKGYVDFLDFVKLFIVSVSFSLSFLQVFGNGVTDVVLSQGAIVVSYSNKSVKLYSFEHIVQKVCMIGKFSAQY